MTLFKVLDFGICQAMFWGGFFLFFVFKGNFIYLFIYGCVGYSLLRGLSLVAASRSYSLLAVRGLLIAVASLVVEHWL